MTAVYKVKSARRRREEDMDKRTYKKRRTKRQQQLRNRKIIACLAVAVLVLIAVCYLLSTMTDRQTDRQTDRSDQLQAESASSAAQTAQETSSQAESASSATQTAQETSAQSQTTQTTAASSNVTSKGYKIEVIDGITYIDGVMIANKTYSLPESYAPGDLLSEVKEAFSVMQKAAAKEGLNIYISSGYRSYNRQVTLYNNYVKSDGTALADTYSSRPGHSEHQTGLCFDLNTIDDSFGNTAESAWLEKHAQEYGFIIRFPKGKESYTGYQYEPWHLRYVGVELATKIYESGLSLEEYFGITSEYAN
jgi:D-alanyl-D-alanine carboxypeptidase